MKISIVGLENQHGATKSFDFLAPAPRLITPDRQEVRALGSLHIWGSITNTGPCYHLDGELEAKLELVCARCLKRYQLNLHVPLDENYVKNEAIEEEEDLRRFQGDEIELDEAVEEGLNLSLPLRGLCDNDCQGLCPICGANRNLVECNCKEERIDPRLAILGKLLDEPQGGGGKNGSTKR
jgi:uncharacterized protein